MARQKRDSEKPKRYMSAFLVFMGEFRKQNSKKGYPITEMTKRGGTVWRKLSTEDKHQYVHTSLKLKKKYDVAMKKYKEMRKSLPKDEKSEQDSVKTTAKDPNRPKKPLSSYMLFMQDYRKQNAKKGWDVTEMVSRGAQVWQTLSKNQIAPYQDKATKLSSAYHKKLEKYKQKQKKSQKAAKKIPDTKTKTPNRASKTNRRDSPKSANVRAKSKSKSTGRRDNSRRR